MWVPNLFRLWERIFWRRQGIRAETTSFVHDGKVTLFVHSWEAFFFVAELKLREVLSWRLKPFAIYIPMLTTPQGVQIPASPYLFAIAVDDVATQPADGATVTVTSGTNIIAINFDQLFNSTTSTGMTLGGTTMTQIGSRVSSGQFSFQCWVLASPPTGSVVLQQTGSASHYQHDFATFSGADQTSVVDNSGASWATNASNPPSATITNVVASGCWMVGGGGCSGALGFNGVTGDFTTRLPSTTTEPCYFSSAGTIGTGAQSGGGTISGSAVSTLIFIAAVQPSASAGATTTVFPALLTLNVG